MKRFQSVAILALTALTLGSTATSSLAQKYEIVTRGPGGAPHVVKKGTVPIGARSLPQGEPHAFPRLATRGPGGASHLTRETLRKAPSNFVAFPNLVNRGPNGAVQIQ